jgi:RecA/RadA recombinase
MSKKTSLEKLSDEIDSTIKSKESKNRIYFRTGCELFDMVIGGNKNVLGVPAGRFINIVGDKSAGKTFLSNEFIAWAYHNLGKNFKWVYDDCESGYSFDTQSLYGFDIMPENPVHSTTVEEAFYHITKFAEKLKENQFGIYVLDSLDGLTSEEQDKRAEERIKSIEDEKEMKGTYGMGKAKYLSQEFFPQLCSVVENKNILVIIISQIRDNVDMFSFEKYARAGGKALDFYAHSVIWLATAKKIEKSDTPVGVVVKAKTTKSKTPRPFRECFFSFLYDYGLDGIGTSVDYLFDLRTSKGELNTKAKAIQWNGNNNLDKKQLKEFLDENELLEKFENSKYYDMDGTDAENMFAFIQSKKDYKLKFNEKFGDTMTRDELITYIEENNLEEELSNRVIEKWENFEDSLKSNRKKKYYATQPE